MTYFIALFIIQVIDPIPIWRQIEKRGMTAGRVGELSKSARRHIPSMPLLCATPIIRQNPLGWR